MSWMGSWAQEWDQSTTGEERPPVFADYLKKKEQTIKLSRRYAALEPEDEEEKEDGGRRWEVGGGTIREERRSKGYPQLGCPSREYDPGSGCTVDRAQGVLPKHDEHPPFPTPTG